MPDFRIRTYRPDDLPFFREMEFTTTWATLSPEERARLSPEEIREALEATHAALLERPGMAIFVAETEAGERAGLLWFGQNRNLVTGETEGWIYNVSVARKWQGRGLGQQLMEYGEAHARAAGYQTLGLMVASHNETAQRLYQRLSFRTTNLIMRKRLAGDHHRR
ncbi:MAG: GNAT family N-acetyltransferase [Armatimonadetes bacterium]|nr:GNAT family N-acetyltransferase [Armatimonadota bacterium]